MTETSSQPPMAWRYCGNQVKLWRMRAGVSREELAKEAGYGAETIKSMEQGRRRATLHVLTVADEMCSANGLLVAAQDYLKPERFPARTHEFMDAEAAAICINAYGSTLIPGLLQTEAYMRTLISECYPPLDDETIEERVIARLQRQQKLTRKPYAQFGFVICEFALRGMVGGREAMKGQLQHLLDVGRLRNVEIQVLRADGGTTLGLIGPVVLLESGEHERFAYVEGAKTSALYTDLETIHELAQHHGMIQARALNPEDSARYLAEVEEQL
ncbi:helix-turn-helix transcriptional regulator [Yinghuangia aomiensis]|uniref:Helix-turn-helix transcriptional regulator n=1 Tax=Yinghuangia aomiensis TaxID=676205 RepID=A0ABP9IAP7_9ACTN